jgi:hypothetical protein
MPETVALSRQLHADGMSYRKIGVALAERGQYDRQWQAACGVGRPEDVEALIAHAETVWMNSITVAISLACGKAATMNKSETGTSPPQPYVTVLPMTLILTVANTLGVHQSSDYMLTTPKGGHVSNEAGSKQLQAGWLEMFFQLAFTGVVTKLSNGQLTIDWLAAELDALPDTPDIRQITTILSERCTKVMKPLWPSGVLTLVLAVSIVGKPFYVIEISNRDWKYKKPIRAKRKFYTQIREVKTPFHLISGYREAVKTSERDRLKALARSSDRSRIRSELAAINALAAQNSEGCISAECCVSSLFAEGPDFIRSEMENRGQRGGAMHSVGAGLDTLDMMELVKKHAGILNPGIVQSASGRGLAQGSIRMSLPQPVGGDSKQSSRPEGEWKIRRTVHLPICRP